MHDAPVGCPCCNQALGEWGFIMRILLGLLVIMLAGCSQPLERTPLLEPAFTDAILEHMRQTQLDNGDEVLALKQLLRGDPDSPYHTRDPYRPATPLSLLECNLDPNCRYSLLATGLPRARFPAAPMVREWWQNRITDPEEAPVCGVQFQDADKIHYRLQTFSSLNALQAEPGFVLTHFQPCGACSSLQDLAVYGELDLTVMAKTCSKRFSLTEKKACMQQIGFTEPCAEAWAFNAQQTAQSCPLVCVNTYGLLPLLKGEEDVPPVDANGNLNPCLLCDEMMSGPGFQYSAGRIRRNSGILSEIDRPEDQVYAVPHDYF